MGYVVVCLYILVNLGLLTLMVFVKTNLEGDQAEDYTNGRAVVYLMYIVIHFHFL